MADVSITVDAQTGKALQGILKLVDGMNKMDEAGGKAGKKLGYLEEQGKKLEGAFEKTFRIDVVNAFTTGLSAVTSALKASVGEAIRLNEELLKAAGSSVGVANLPALQKGLDEIQTRFGSKADKLAAANAAAGVLGFEATPEKMVAAASFGAESIGLGADANRAAEAFAILQKNAPELSDNDRADTAEFIRKSTGKNFGKFLTGGSKTIAQLKAGGLGNQDAISLYLASLQSDQGDEALRTVIDKLGNLPAPAAGKRGQAGGDQFAALRDKDLSAQLEILKQNPELLKKIGGEQATELGLIFSKQAGLKSGLAEAQAGDLFESEQEIAERVAGKTRSVLKTKAAISDFTTGAGDAVLNTADAALNDTDGARSRALVRGAGGSPNIGLTLMQTVVSLLIEANRKNDPANKLGPDGGG